MRLKRLVSYFLIALGLILFVVIPQFVEDGRNFFMTGGITLIVGITMYISNLIIANNIDEELLELEKHDERLKILRLRAYALSGVSSMIVLALGLLLSDYLNLPLRTITTISIILFVEMSRALVCFLEGKTSKGVTWLIAGLAIAMNYIFLSSKVILFGLALILLIAFITRDKRSRFEEC